MIQFPKAKYRTASVFPTPKAPEPTELILFPIQPLPRTVIVLSPCEQFLFSLWI